MTHFSLYAVLLVAANFVSQGVEERSARTCLQPWLDGVDLIAKKDLTNAEVKRYQEMVHNPVLVKPIEVDGQRAIQVLSEAPRKDQSWIVVMPVCSESELPNSWAKHFKATEFMASFSYEAKSITVRANWSPPPLLRGLILLHEMRHSTQKVTKELREVDAYEFEFAVMDQLSLPGYDSLIRDEVARLKQESSIHGRFKPNFGSTRVNQFFGSTHGNERASDAVASEIFLRAAFKLFDSEGTAKVALQKKLQFLSSIGYK